MKGIKRLILEIMVLCFALIGILTPEIAYARNFGKVEATVIIQEGNGSSINKKRKLIPKYTGYKEYNIDYYSEMIVGRKRCSAFSYIDDGGYIRYHFINFILF